MTIDQEFYDTLAKLEHYKNNTDWKEFFKSIDELGDLGTAINEEMHEDPSDTSKLDARAKALVETLIENKTKIAEMTKDNVEYDAVFEAISYLDTHFNFEK